MFFRKHFFLNIYVSANIFFKHIRLCKYFFKHIRLRSTNIFFQHHLRANNFFHFLTAIVESHFFKKYLAIFRFVNYLLKTEWPLFSAQSVLIFILMPQFVTLFFISVLVEIFFNTRLLSKHFFLTLSRLQTIYFLFSDPENNFFLNISHDHTCPSENNGPYAGIE